MRRGLLRTMGGEFNYLFDDYNNGYIGLSFRKLDTQYNGFCCRIVNRTNSLQQDVGFVNNYVNLQEIQNFSNNFQDDISLVIWYDQSGNGLNFERVSAVVGLNIVENGNFVLQNGKLSVKFNGVANGLGGLINNISGTQPNTIIIIANNSDIDKTFYASKNPLANNISHTLSVEADINEIKAFSGTFLTADFNATSRSLISNIVNGVDSQLRGNGNLLITGNQNTRNFDTTFTLGINRTTTSSASINGNIQEFVLFSDNKINDIELIEEQINSYYNIY